MNTEFVSNGEDMRASPPIQVFMGPGLRRGDSRGMSR